MRRRHPSIIAFGVAACLALSSVAQPALAGGLISTERVAAAPVEPRSAQAVAQDAAAAHRLVLVTALVNAGVDPTHAQARLAALTDAEVAELSTRYAQAPAGGLWFAPFLLVAIVIGALIGRNERPRGQAEGDTDLFGRPRNIAAAP